MFILRLYTTFYVYTIKISVSFISEENFSICYDLTNMQNIYDISPGEKVLFQATLYTTYMYVLQDI